MNGAVFGLVLFTFVGGLTALAVLVVAIMRGRIDWSSDGARVIFGVPGLKVHSKLFLITRREDGKLVNYAHIGSGNMNESTSKVYTDKSLLTVRKSITEEIQEVFDFYNDNLKHGTYKQLCVSLFNMRKKFTHLIQREIENAQKGRPAWILLKINNLVDREMILKLYEASRAGVVIDVGNRVIEVRYAP